jgi:hypothetical protein
VQFIIRIHRSNYIQRCCFLNFYFRKSILKYDFRGSKVWGKNQEKQGQYFKNTLLFDLMLHVWVKGTLLNSSDKKYIRFIYPEQPKNNSAHEIR